MPGTELRVGDSAELNREVPVLSGGGLTWWLWLHGCLFFPPLPSHPLSSPSALPSDNSHLCLRICMGLGPPVSLWLSLHLILLKAIDISPFPFSQFAFCLLISLWLSFMCLYLSASICLSHSVLASATRTAVSVSVCLSLSLCPHLWLSLAVCLHPSLFSFPVSGDFLFYPSLSLCLLLFL